LAFVKRKLRDADINLDYTREQIACVERLGGRASDLESVGISSGRTTFKTENVSTQLIYKVRNGATVEAAVDDIIIREVSEVRKKAFGDDADDAKNLPWGREQAWSLFKRLSKQAEVCDLTSGWSLYSKHLADSVPRPAARFSV
jgi:hypothetical protein